MYMTCMLCGKDIDGKSMHDACRAELVRRHASGRCSRCGEMNAPPYRKECSKCGFGSPYLDYTGEA